MDEIPKYLKPGHGLFYEGKDAFGNAIDFFEQGKFCHVAGVYDSTRLVRQNPGGPAYEDLNVQPWPNIVAKRLVLDSLVGQSGSPVALLAGYDPHSDEAWIDQFRASYERHKGDVYDYPGIVNAQNEGILSMVGLSSLVAHLKQRVDPITAADSHMDYCSAFYAIMLQEATQARFTWPSFVFDPKENIRQLTPQDLSTVGLLVNIA